MTAKNIVFNGSGLLEIKHPFAYLTKDSDAIMIYFQGDDGFIYVWCDSPLNYPRWSLMKFETIELAKSDVADNVHNYGYELETDNRMDY